MLSFTGNTLNRASEKRCDPTWVTAKRAEPATRILPLWRLQPLLREGGNRVELGFLDPSAFAPTTAQEVFLGLEDERAFFARDVSSAEPPEFGPGYVFRDARGGAALLSLQETAILGQAKAMIDWHGRHLFCARCGHATHSVDAGYRRLCPHCEAEHFPRTDPAVIMLVIAGERCLLAHNRRFAENFYSALAGFVEPGETIEEAVRREVFEEVNIHVGDVRYYATQPWPFPASLMIGCYAEARSEDILADGHEIAVARWFERRVVRAMLAGETFEDILLPRREAIAFHLIKNWAEA